VLVGDTDELLIGREINQPCAVRSELDGQWYRGQLKSLDEDHDVFEVSLVDVGRTEQTSRHGLRLLQHGLLTRPVTLLQLTTQFHNRRGKTTPLCLSVCLSVCLSACVCLCLSVLLTRPMSLLQLSTQFNNRRGKTTPLCLSVCLPMCLYVCVCLSACVYLYLSVGLSVCDCCLFTTVVYVSLCLFFVC